MYVISDYLVIYFAPINGAQTLHWQDLCRLDVDIKTLGWVHVSPEVVRLRPIACKWRELGNKINL